MNADASRTRGRSGPIRVAYMIDNIPYETGGTERQLLETLRRIDPCRVEASLVCLNESAWMAGRRLPSDAEILGYRGMLTPAFAGTVRRLARFLDDRRIEILQTFFMDSIFVAWAAAALARTRPVLLSSRRDLGLDHEPWYHGVFRAALPWVNRSFDGIVVNCEAIKRHVIRHERVPAAKVRVIENGIVAETEPVARPALFARHPAETWIVIAAALTEVKRVDLLLRAFARLRTATPTGDVRLAILGEGPDEADLRTLSTELGVASRVHFEGVVEDVSAYLQHADIGVLCSQREGLSNAILEYMNAGLPVVATAVGGNPELVDEANGILVPAGDEIALADALGKIADDRALRERLGAASRARILERFSWDRTLDETIRYYDQLLADRRSEAAA